VRDRERGSALLLMPAAVLVMVVLGAFAVDAAVVFLAEREVANLAAGIANDIAGAALDREDFYEGSGGGRDVRIDPDRAREVLELSLGAYRPDHLRDVRPLALSYPAADEVAVRIGASVDYVFSSALPSAADGADVNATATAAARQE
jgi:hypothetical protein